MVRSMTDMRFNVEGETSEFEFLFQPVWGQLFRELRTTQTLPAVDAFVAGPIADGDVAAFWTGGRVEFFRRQGLARDQRVITARLDFGEINHRENLAVMDSGCNFRRLAVRFSRHS